MTSMVDTGDLYIHLKEISVDFIKRRPKSVLELVLKDRAGVMYKSKKFKQGNRVHWNIDMHVRTYTSVILTIKQGFSNTSITDISVNFKPNEFRDHRTVRLQDSNHYVAVDLICGRSQSLADIARVGSLASTAFPSTVRRLSKLPQLAAIQWLNDDILLCIFNCYRLDKENRWNFRLGWRKLSQVCQRWRYLIYESTFHLGMHIACTYGTPKVGTLDHLLQLPVHIDYTGNSINEKDGLEIYYVLRLHDRVRHIRLHLPPSILRKCLMLMDKCFPILEDLTLCPTADSLALTLPEAFLAPNLRCLALSGIGLPNKLQLLTSLVSLVRLDLTEKSNYWYLPPKLFVAYLSSLHQLKQLSILFGFSIPHPSTDEWEVFGIQGTPVTLPNLTSLTFHGASRYLESFIAQIRAPLLEWFDITLHLHAFVSLPHLSHFINVAERFKHHTAEVLFSQTEALITTLDHSSPGASIFRSHSTDMHRLDWQIDWAAQICKALISALSSVERFVLNFYRKKPPTAWQNGEIDSTAWRNLLRPFVGVKELHIEGGILMELSRALQVDGVGSDPGFLPNLQDIVAERNEFTSFIDARRVVGRPVRFSPPPPPPSSPI